MAAKLKIEKKGDEILIVHCCFSINGSGELKRKEKGIIIYKVLSK
jgi:hypothetical protein